MKAVRSFYDLPHDHILVQGVKFLGIGVFAAAAHYGLYVGLVAHADWTPTLATLAGFVVSTYISYVLNAKYTFHAPLGGPVLIRFWLVTVGGGLLNAGVVEGLVRATIDYRLAGVLAIVCGASFNFAGHRLWTFRNASPSPSLPVEE